ncbi:DNA internalization-related competence protein ComEC/Rec2 [Neobacillus terrae]|uniref:DNA internalization-related competence protein ComEC/Rec2 n=1 Tax=Neobacillus terrae TaxID=3034837 RepID=UPI00140D9B39|nr:DNA internalization-related competence protein ComEC/Rec2 [Neobacillus terrae]NHM30385.1 DNA internalization-related competence protein ComEC/Rec2 [Neobacillus terrae]
MSGKLIYLSIASLFGILASMESFLILTFFFLMYLFFLYYFKSFPFFRIIAVSIVFVLFLFSSHWILKENHSRIESQQTEFSLVFNSENSIRGDQYETQAMDSKTEEKILVRFKISSEEEKNSLEHFKIPNQLCTVSGELQKPLIVKNPNAFNYEKYLNRKNIFWILRLQKYPYQNCIPIKRTPSSILKEIRMKGVNYLEDYFPEETAAMAAALIFGERAAFEPDLLAAYQKIGIIHLLAISGLHVSLSIGLLYLTGLRAGVSKEKMILFILVFLPAYAILTGGSPSVIRSVLMIFNVTAAAASKRRFSLQPADAISLALMVYIFVNPFAVYDAGFQLSFSVSFSLILSSAFILAQPSSLFESILKASYISQLSALPFLLFHFYEVSFLGIFVNLFYIPLYSFFFLPGVYLLFFWHLLMGTIPDFLNYFFSAVVTFSDTLAKRIALIPWGSILIGRPSGPGLLLFAVIGPIMLVYWEKSLKKKKSWVYFVLPLLLLFIVDAASKIDPRGEITMIDVGQGDSILIKLPFDQGNYLIDTGGSPAFEQDKWRKPPNSFETGRNIVVPFLKSKGIKEIDKLILTHGDMDHIGGSFAVLKSIKVKQIIMPAVSNQNNAVRDVIQIASLQKIPVCMASAGDQWKSRSSFFKILSPEKNFEGDTNTGSLVLYAEVGDLKWLFTGDLDIEGEQSLLKRYPNLKTDVLKAGHHGSRTSTSTEFLETLQPKTALISAGEKNHFGHPHAEVLDKLKKRGIMIFRTDKQGAITYSFFRGKGTFSVFRP